jgi:polar amino acid transport system substrate-binding protein
MKKFRVIFIVVVIMSIFSLEACDKATYYNEVFIASGHPAWPPIMYQEGNEIIGAGPELVLMILNELGLNAESRFVGSWDVVQDKARSGEIDAIVAAYKTPERETYMGYSIAYATDPVSIFVKKGESFPFENFDNLLGKLGVITRGDSYGEEFDQFIQENLSSFIVVDSPSDAFELIITGEADYFVYALYAGEEAMKNDPVLAEQIEILPKNIAEPDFYITISKESRLIGYLSQINQILQRFIDNGTVNELIQKYKNL